MRTCRRCSRPTGPCGPLASRRRPPLAARPLRPPTLCTQKGVEAARFHHGVLLLGRNVQQLLWSLGQPPQHPPWHVLPSLQLLLSALCRPARQLPPNRSRSLPALLRRRRRQRQADKPIVPTDQPLADSRPAPSAHPLPSGGRDNGAADGRAGDDGGGGHRTRGLAGSGEEWAKGWEGANGQGGQGGGTCVVAAGGRDCCPLTCSEGRDASNPPMPARAPQAAPQLGSEAAMEYAAAGVPAPPYTRPAAQPLQFVNTSPWIEAPD